MQTSKQSMRNLIKSVLNTFCAHLSLMFVATRDPSSICLFSATGGSEFSQNQVEVPSSKDSLQGEKKKKMPV